jgi:hypothetical protein
MVEFDKYPMTKISIPEMTIYAVSLVDFRSHYTPMRDGVPAKDFEVSDSVIRDDGKRFLWAEYIPAMEYCYAMVHLREA